MTNKPQESFSPWRKWSIGLNVVLIILALLAVVVIVNYFSHDYFLRSQWSTQTKIQLSPRTLSLLHSITNQVKVTLYYDKKEPLYSTVVDLLNQYSLVNPKISVTTVDYLRDPPGAQKVKNDYKLGAATEKNLVFFDCEGRMIVIDGNALTHYILEPGEAELKFRRKPTEFEGETRFSAALLGVTSAAPLHACFLQGHREHSLEGGGDYDYLKFKSILQQNYVRVEPLSLVGTNLVPPDCNLLVIAGAADAISDPELDKIDKYLAQGGRMLVLFNATSISKETGLEKTGLEKVLANWGVEVGTQIIHDPGNFVLDVRSDMVVNSFNQNHPLVNPLLGSPGLYLAVPRSIGKLKAASQAADSPRVEPLAFTGPRAITANSSHAQVFPLIVAVEKGAIKGVITERGATRLVVAGDSFFLANAWIDSAVNREFAGYAINWLLNRAQLLEGIGQRPVKEYRIIMSNSQLQSAEWILLAGLPGGVLILGSAVWLRRRK